MSHRKGFGPHLMLDLYECDFSVLSSLEKCFNFLDILPIKIGMTKITPPYVFPYEGLKPEDKGITGAVIIAESHLTLHTFSLKGCAFIDIFSCKPFDTDQTSIFCKDFFKPKLVDTHLSQRGKRFPSKTIHSESVLMSLKSATI